MRRFRDVRPPFWLHPFRNRTAQRLVFAGLVVGCATPDAQEDPKPAPTVVPPCSTLVQGLPTHGQGAVHPAGPLHWTFSGPAEPFVDVFDASGSPVPGAASLSGYTALWTPDVPLAAASAYQVRLTWCDDPQTLDLDFTTAAAPPVSANPGGLASPVYVVDLSSGTVVDPPVVGALFSDLITVDLLVGILDQDATSLELHGALALENQQPPAQDRCIESIDLPVADFTSSPAFTVGPQDVTLFVLGLPVALEDLSFAGTFSPSGEAIEDVQLAGVLDTLALDPIVAPGSGPGATCDLLAAFGVACLPCSSGAPTCVSLAIEDLTATEVPGAEIEVRTAADISADPACP